MHISVDAHTSSVPRDISKRCMSNVGTYKIRSLSKISAIWKCLFPLIAQHRPKQVLLCPFCQWSSELNSADIWPDVTTRKRLCLWLKQEPSFVAFSRSLLFVVTHSSAGLFRQTDLQKTVSGRHASGWSARERLILVLSCESWAVSLTYLDSQQGCVPSTLFDDFIVNFTKLIFVLALAKMNASACAANSRWGWYCAFHMSSAQKTWNIKISACSAQSSNPPLKKPQDGILSALVPDLSSNSYASLQEVFNIIWDVIRCSYITARAQISHVHMLLLLNVN